MKLTSPSFLLPKSTKNSSQNQTNFFKTEMTSPDMISSFGDLSFRTDLRSI